MLVCFDIGGTFIRAGEAGPDGIQLLGEVPTPVADLQAFVAVLRGFLDGAGAVSIAIAGAVDPATGRLRVANIPCLDGLAVGTVLQDALGLPVLVSNDADCFAYAEASSGAGVGHGTVFGIILGTGVGGGLVIDGRIVTGAGGFAGEWGHGPVLNRLPLEIDVPHFACGCGLAGCVETVGGARGMARLHRHLTGEAADSAAILARRAQGDAAAVRTIEVWLDLLSGPLAMVVNVVGASVVPVGGGLGNDAGLVADLDLAVRARILRPTDAPLLVPARHRINPALIGAAALGAGLQAARAM